MSNNEEPNSQEKKIQYQPNEQNEKNQNNDKKIIDKGDKKQIYDKNKNNKKFRVEERKRIQIPSHLNSREKAQILRNITIYLFGSRRYKNIQLSCNLKSFSIALQMASIVYHRVDGLAMIIKFQKIPYVEYEDENAEGVSKEYSILILKLTKFPTQKDEKEPGYHPGKAREQIEEPLTQILKTGTQNKYKNQNRRRDNRDRDNRQYNRGYNDKYDDRRDYKEYKPYKEKVDYKEKSNNRDRNYNSSNYNKDYPKKYEKTYKQEYKEKDEKKKYRELNNEKVNDNTERRGERKSRGVGRNPGNERVQHDYNPKHLTRDVNVNKKQKNRYDD